MLINLLLGQSCTWDPYHQTQINQLEIAPRKVQNSANTRDIQPIMKAQAVRKGAHACSFSKFSALTFEAILSFLSLQERHARIVSELRRNGRSQ